VRSMTGFGSGEEAAPKGGKLVVELRAVNHRYLEVRVRASREAADMTALVEALVRERFPRGRFDAVVHAEGLTMSAPTLDRAKATQAYRELVQLRDDVAPGEPVPLSLLAAVPDLFVVPSASQLALKGVLKQAFDAAARDLDAMREREGAALARDVREHLARATKLVADVEARAPGAVLATHERLRDRVAKLTSTAAGTLDAARLEQEIALLADRSDVAEETARLRSHCEQLGEVFHAEGPIGRRIDFLLQEMAREVNTIGSKSADVEMSRVVVELKVEVERMREQAQNIE
jgi:uncharacterized protein (TIGR00255 family)